MWISIHRARIQPGFRHRLGDKIPRIAGRVHIMDAQPFGDDLKTGHARAETAIWILKNNLHILAQAAQFAGRPFADILPVESDAPFGCDQTHDRQRQRRLT